MRQLDNREDIRRSRTQTRQHLTFQNSFKLHRAFQASLHSFRHCLSMSTGPRAQTDIKQGNQSKVEQNSPQCALFYLFQEVSKLASPVHSSFPDSNLPTEWPNATFSKDSLVIKKEEDLHLFETSISSTQDTLELKKEEDSHSFHACNHSCHDSLSKLLPCDELKNVSEECQSSKVAATLEPQSERNSPWKVLSLINLQCEKLLHQENPEELHPSSASSAIKLGYSIAKSSSAAPHVIETGVRSGECMLGPSSLPFERQEITPSVSVTGNPTGDRFKLQCCVKDSKMGVQLQTAEETDTVRAESLKDSTTASLHLQHRSKIDVSFSVSKQTECSQECKKDCSSSKQDILDVPLSEADNACLNAKLTYNSNETCAPLSKPMLTLDHNANLTLSVESQCDNQLPPLSPIQPSSQSRSPSLTFSTAESSLSVSNQDECTDAPLEEEAPPAAPIRSCASKAELWTVQNEEIGPSSSRQWRTPRKKTPRKQPHPSRSADIQDPDFQGVTFRMDTELDESREEFRLLITSKYSKELCKSVRKPRLRTRSSLKASSSDEENGLTNNVLKGKVCASCCTRKTPMWRDAEDGTPLCNACGIRYKKYRVRCVNCWHIPRKEGNSNSCCLKCGNFVRLTSAQRKDTT